MHDMNAKMGRKSPITPIVLDFAAYNLILVLY
jgi:hypothetical protein